MARLGGSWTAVAAVLATAAVCSHAAGVWAGGGAGPGLDPRSDVAEAEAAPRGFVSFVPSFSLGSQLSFGLAQPIEFTTRREETADPVELKGLTSGYSSGLSLNLRIDCRFPSFAGPEARADGSKPSYALWANDAARDSLADEELLAPRSIELGGLALEKNFNAERNWRGAARKWLGDDAFNELGRQFGSAADSVAAKDVSEWNDTYLYRGGACIAAVPYTKSR